MEHSIENMISIIVPVYKIKEAYLRKCIESLIDQERNDYRIILIDDGSPDNCGDICDEYAAKNHIISVIHQNNAGVSEARNTGIKATQTKWLTFVDADDWVENDYITTLYGVISGEASGADMIMFDYIREYLNFQSKEHLRVVEGFLNAKQLEIVHRAPFYKLIQDGKFNPYTVIGLWDKVYRTEFLRRNNIWFIPEAKKGQDRLLNADALNATDKIFYLNKTLYHYRCWGESRTNRYDPNIINLTLIEIAELRNQMVKHCLTGITEDYIKCRICTRLYSCMRLYFFNDSNPDGKKERISKAKKLVNGMPYKDALKEVRLSLLSAGEKIFVMCLKLRLYWLIYFMVKVKSRNRDNKLS